MGGSGWREEGTLGLGSRHDLVVVVAGGGITTACSTVSIQPAIVTATVTLGSVMVL